MNNKNSAIDVALLIPTKDRPDNIQYLLTIFNDLGFFQKIDLEIIVIDSSLSNQTKKIVSMFPVQYIEAKGLNKSSAMNKALNYTDAKFVTFIDDDVIIIDPQWIDKLRKNFTDNTIGYVGGRVIAYKTETPAEKMWEAKGGLDKGSEKRVYGEHFFKRFRLRGVPVRLFSIGANHMMRRTVLNDIDAHDERWGPGSTISGAGTDLDLGYKVLKHGYTAIYEPNSVVAHRHSETAKELWVRLFNYGIADTAIYVKFAMEYGDFRSWGELIYRPLQQFFRLIKSLVGLYPLRADFITASILGNFIGIIMYFRYVWNQSPRNVNDARD